MDMDLGFHEALPGLCMPELQRDDYLQPMLQPPCSLHTAINSLSQLIPRLQILSKNSLELKENREVNQKFGYDVQARTTLFSNDAVFKLVAAWFLNSAGDTDDDWVVQYCSVTCMSEEAKGEILLELLSCSSKLTKTTQSLQEEFGTRSPASPCFSSVAQHLVVACHILLLSSFASVLGALQDDAEAARPADKAAVITPQRDAGLDDLRLTMAAQLCSYLSVRQCCVVDAYLQTDSGPKSSAVSPNDATEDQKVIQELKAQIESRIAWFQSL
ncbi:hypothetical protein IL306_014492 [Fusarium sp. DS 682]|nr:hypothetical protein IL306_014492 [Fusarium sp. DS 682]